LRRDFCCTLLEWISQSFALLVLPRFFQQAKKKQAELEAAARAAAARALAAKIAAAKAVAAEAAARKARAEEQARKELAVRLLPIVWVWVWVGGYECVCVHACLRFRLRVLLRLFESVFLCSYGCNAFSLVSFPIGL
jgi:hypothetical protein